MNNIKYNNTIIGLGFLLEVEIFYLAGFLLGVQKFVFSFLLFYVGVMLGYIVAKKIEKNAIEKWKWGIYE